MFKKITLAAAILMSGAVAPVAKAADAVSACAALNTMNFEAAADNPLAVLGKMPSNEITDARMVGNYAIAFTWSDGHDTGIYTWELLRRLAEDPSVETSGLA